MGGIMWRGLGVRNRMYIVNTWTLDGNLAGDASQWQFEAERRRASLLFQTDNHFSVCFKMLQSVTKGQASCTVSPTNWLCWLKDIAPTQNLYRCISSGLNFIGNPWPLISSCKIKVAHCAPLIYRYWLVTSCQSYKYSSVNWYGKGMITPTVYLVHQEKLFPNCMILVSLICRGRNRTCGAYTLLHSLFELLIEEENDLWRM